MSRGFFWGRFESAPPLSPAGAERLCRQAEERRERASSRHFWKTLDVLHATGRLWADPRSPFRRRAQALMPRISGFSSATVRQTLEIIPLLLDKRTLRRRLAAELGREDALDAWSLDPEGATAVKAFPLGAVLHVAAGNIFLGCIDSVVMSLLTNNVTLLRLSASDTTFPLLFAESLVRADKAGALGSTLSILSWPRGAEAVESVFKRRLQGIVVWGGESAVSAYRRNLGVGAKLIAFGPKLSFGVVSRAGLERFGVKKAARRAARDVALWDQAACASPQTLFVQDRDPRAFLDALAAEFSRLARTQPMGAPTPDEAASLLEERHRALTAELLGRGRLLAPKDLGWTVAWNRESSLKASPLRRFLHVRPYKDIDDLSARVSGSAPYLQSAGLLVGAAETGAYAEALAAAGASRAPELGRMLESETGEPHDGRYALGELVRWVSGPAAAVSDNVGKALAGVLEQSAAESSFYSRRLRGATARALEHVPFLDKEDLYRHGPPRSEALLTQAGEGRGRVVFASGGSTGKPKFSF
ncbi:MAG: acyl-CoA reductase, partial [Solirubrobacteraceae bacterium]